MRSKLKPQKYLNKPLFGLLSFLTSIKISTSLLTSLTYTVPSIFISWHRFHPSSTSAFETLSSFQSSLYLLPQYSQSPNLSFQTPFSLRPSETPPPPPPLQPPDSVTFSKVLDRFRSAFWVGSSSQPLDYSTVQIKTLPLLLLQSPTLPLPPPNLNLLSVPQIQQHPILDPSNHYLHSSWLNTRSPTSIHLLYLALPSNNNMQFFGFSLTFSSSSNPQYSRQSFHPIAFLLCSSPQTHPSRLVCCVFFASSSRYPRLGSTTSLCISISSWYQGGFTLFFSLLIRSQTYLRSSLPNGLANVPRSTQ